MKKILAFLIVFLCLNSLYSDNINYLENYIKNIQGHIFKIEDNTIYITSSDYFKNLPLNYPINIYNTYNNTKSKFIRKIEKGKARIVKIGEKFITAEITSKLTTIKVGDLIEKGSFNVHITKDIPKNIKKNILLKYDKQINIVNENPDITIDLTDKKGLPYIKINGYNKVYYYILKQKQHKPTKKYKKISLKKISNQTFKYPIIDVKIDYFNKRAKKSFYFLTKNYLKVYNENFLLLYKYKFSRKPAGKFLNIINKKIIITSYLPDFLNNEIYNYNNKMLSKIDDLNNIFLKATDNKKEILYQNFDTQTPFFYNDSVKKIKLSTYKFKIKTKLSKKDFIKNKDFFIYSAVKYKNFKAFINKQNQIELYYKNKFITKSNNKFIGSLISFEKFSNSTKEDRNNLIYFFDIDNDKIPEIFAIQNQQIFANILNPDLFYSEDFQNNSNFIIYKINLVNKKLVPIYKSKILSGKMTSFNYYKKQIIISLYNSKNKISKLLFYKIQN